MRSHLGKVAEAEQFIREGLQHIPGEPELLFELGRIYRENHKDINRSRRIWQAALSQFRKTRTTETTEDILLYAQMLIHLAKLEEEAGDYVKAAGYLKDLLVVSPTRRRSKSPSTPSSRKRLRRNNFGARPSEAVLRYFAGTLPCRTSCGRIARPSVPVGSSGMRMP